MLIGNRRRSQMQRTISITKFTVEIDDDDQEESDVAMTVVDGGDSYDQRLFSLEKLPRNERKDDGESSSPSSLLGNCGFCKRRLAPGRDIYMYKGDAAFCSVECREQQMEYDEDKTRNSVVN